MATITRISLEQNEIFSLCPLVFWAPNTRTITAVELHQDTDFVSIVPVGARKSTIHGGLRMSNKDMHKLCETFLELDSKSQEA